MPNPDKPEPNKMSFHHENTKLRKHEKQDLISCFLLSFRGFVIVFNSFALLASLRACLSEGARRQATHGQARTLRLRTKNDPQ